VQTRASGLVAVTNSGVLCLHCSGDTKLQALPEKLTTTAGIRSLAEAHLGEFYFVQDSLPGVLQVLRCLKQKCYRESFSHGYSVLKGDLLKRAFHELLEVSVTIVPHYSEQTRGIDEDISVYVLERKEGILLAQSFFAGAALWSKPNGDYTDVITALLNTNQAVLEYDGGWQQSSILAINNFGRVSRSTADGAFDQDGGIRRVGQLGQLVANAPGILNGVWILTEQALIHDGEHNGSWMYPLRERQWALKTAGAALESSDVQLRQRSTDADITTKVRSRAAAI